MDKLLDIPTFTLPISRHEGGEWFQPLHIINETDPLQAAVVWGGIGNEAVLAQLYPPEVSLFFDDMDVPVARGESYGFIGLLEQHGVKVYQARDMLVEIIPEAYGSPGMNYDQLLQALIGKAKSIHTFYKGDVPKDWVVPEELATLLKQDIDRYGKKEAVALNHRLCLAYNLPLGNAVFARDQANVAFDIRIQASMAKSIRQPEVALYDMVYRKILGMDVPIRIPAGETFEGGDLYLHNKVVFIGVGARTSMGAAIHIAKELSQRVQQYGFQIAAFVDEEAALRTRQEQMDFMHLDTITSPLAHIHWEERRKMMTLPQEIERRKAFDLTPKGRGEVEPLALSNAKDYLKSFLWYDLTEVPLVEQQAFGLNNLPMGDFTEIIPSFANETSVDQLVNAGQNVVSATLNNITKGYGAAHCLVMPLFRG